MLENFLGRVITDQMIEVRSRFFSQHSGLFVDNSHELAANPVDLFAVQPSRRLRNFADVVVIATQVCEGRPPLFGPGGFRATAHVAGQVNPDGARGGRFIGTGLS